MCEYNCDNCKKLKSEKEKSEKYFLENKAEKYFFIDKTSMNDTVKWFSISHFPSDDEVENEILKNKFVSDNRMRNAFIWCNSTRKFSTDKLLPIHNPEGDNYKDIIDIYKKYGYVDITDRWEINDHKFVVEKN
jgi:hypothetical protein